MIVDSTGQLFPLVDQALFEVVLEQPFISDNPHCFPSLLYTIVDSIGQLFPQVNQALFEVVLGQPSISNIPNRFPSLLYDCGLNWTTISSSQSSTF
jgi:hypothetical protein